MYCEFILDFEILELLPHFTINTSAEELEIGWLFFGIVLGYDNDINI